MENEENRLLGKLTKILKDFLKDFIPALIAVLLCIKFIFIPCIVEGTSMYSTLHNKDFGLSFVITKNIEIKRFDIVVVKLKTENGRLLVKRVIGMPNDTIEYKDNILYVNGVKYEEDFLDDEAITNDFNVTLGENEYYCLGDNRKVSRDCRFYGPFTNEMIVSSHFFVFYPFERFGFNN